MEGFACLIRTLILLGFAAQFLNSKVGDSTAKSLKSVFIIGMEGSGTTWVSRTLAGLHFAELLIQPYLRNESTRSLKAYEWVNHDLWSSQSESLWMNAAEQAYLIPRGIKHAVKSTTLFTVHHRSIPDWDGFHFPDIRMNLIQTFWAEGVELFVLFVARNPAASALSNFRRCSSTDFFHLHNPEGGCSALMSAKSTELSLSYATAMLHSLPSRYYRVVEYEHLLKLKLRTAIIDELGKWLGLPKEAIRQWHRGFSAMEKRTLGPVHVMESSKSVKYANEVLTRFYDDERLRKWNWLETQSIGRSLGFGRPWYCSALNTRSAISLTISEDSTVKISSKTQKTVPRQWQQEYAHTVRTISLGGSASRGVTRFLGRYVKVVQNREKLKLKPCNFGSPEVNEMYRQECRKNTFSRHDFNRKHRSVFLFQNISEVLCTDDLLNSREFCLSMIGDCSQRGTDGLRQGVDVWEYSTWLMDYLNREKTAMYPILAVNTMHPAFGAKGFGSVLLTMLNIDTSDKAVEQLEYPRIPSTCNNEEEALTSSFFERQTSLSKCLPLLFWL